MDIKRSILLVALAIVSYIWFCSGTRTTARPLPAGQNNVASTAAPTLPDDQAGAVPVHDVPVAATQPHRPTGAARRTSSNQLIRVQTDVLELAIDPRGGDIVQLTLPQYPRQLQNRRTCRSSCSTTATSAPTWRRAA